MADLLRSEGGTMKHHVWMLSAGLAPLLLMLALPALRGRSNGLFTLLILGCFVIQLFKLRGLICGGGPERFSVAEDGVAWRNG